MTTKTREPRTFGDALLLGPDSEGIPTIWHFETRGVGVRFSPEDVKAYCRENVDQWPSTRVWRIYVDHQIFSDPRIRRGDWLIWDREKPDELQLQRITPL
jgi:hypothetical protein